MIFVSEFMFFLIFLFLKLYSFLVNNVMLSATGGKLDKYIENLKNIACNLRKSQKKKSFNLKSFLINLPSWYKQFFITLFVSTDILILKFVISYDFLVSNTLFIKIYDKNIEIAYLLGNKYIFFKILYYILFYIFIFYIISKLYPKISFKKSFKIVVNENSKLNIKIPNLNENIISIEEKGLYQNILITGSIGSGKTSCAISNLLDGLLKNDIGGIVIDIKGNYASQVENVADKYGKKQDVIKISLDNNFVYNPLDDSNLSSIEMASVIKKVLVIISNNNVGSDPFWLDKAEEYIKDFITLIRIYNGGCVNFKELHNMAISKSYLEEKLKVIKNKVLNNELTEDQLFEVNSAIQNINNDYLSLDQRTFGIIKSEITRMTSIFLSNSKICNKFCGKSKKIDFYSGKIYVLSLDISNNNKLSTIISTYLKLQFQRQVLQNGIKNKPIFFVCDEYQEICNMQDANFFSLSREYKCINIVSMQSYSSLINKLRDEHVSNVILQNFVNKIWFRNDDEYTIKKIVSQLGKKKIINKTMSYSENGKNARFSKLSKKFISYKSDFSQSYSEVESIQNKYTEDYFSQELATFEAMCLISDGSKIKLYEKVKIKRWEESDYEKQV